MSIDNNFNHVAFLWNIAESLRGTYKEEDYRKVMLPMIVVRRFDCLLDDYDREIIKSVYKEYDFLPEEEKDDIVIADLKENHNMDLQFYNVSDFTWKKLLDDSENIKSNFPTEDFDTLGGFVLDLFGRIPVKYEKINWGGFEFIVQDMEGHRVNLIKVIKKAESEEPKKD